MMKKQYKRNFYTKKDAGATFLLSLLAPQFVGVLLASLIMAVFAFTNQTGSYLDNPIALIFLTMATQISFILIYVLYNATGKINHKKASHLDFKVGWGNVIVSIVIGLVTLFGFQYLIGLVDYWLSLTNYTPTNLPFPIDTIPWLFANIFLLAFIPAVAEELVFRGMIMNGLKQYGIKTAIIGSALLFALIHGNPQQTLYPIVFGIILAILAHKTNSIVPGMIAHFCNNALVLIFTYFTQNQTSTPTAITYLWYDYVIAIVAAVIAVAVIYFLSMLLKQKNKENNHPSPSPLTEEEKNKLIEFALEQQPQENEEYQNLMQKSNHYFIYDDAKKSINKMLWIGVALGVLLWVVSLFL